MRYQISVQILMVCVLKALGTFYPIVDTMNIQVLQFDTSKLYKYLVFHHSFGRDFIKRFMAM